MRFDGQLGIDISLRIYVIVIFLQFNIIKPGDGLCKKIQVGRIRFQVDLSSAGEKLLVKAEECRMGEPFF